MANKKSCHLHFDNSHLNIQNILVAQVYLYMYLHCNQYNDFVFFSVASDQANKINKSIVLVNLNNDRHHNLYRDHYLQQYQNIFRLRTLRIHPIYRVDHFFSLLHMAYMNFFHLVLPTWNKNLDHNFCNWNRQ